MISQLKGINDDCGQNVKMDCTLTLPLMTAIKIKVGQTLEFKGDHGGVILTQPMGSFNLF